MKTIEQYFHVVLFDMLYRVPDETFFQIAIIFFFCTCRDHLLDLIALTMKLFGCPLISCGVFNR